MKSGDFYTGFRRNGDFPVVVVCHVSEVAKKDDVLEIYKDFSIMPEIGNFIIYSRINSDNLFLHGVFKTLSEAFKYGVDKLNVSFYYSGLSGSNCVISFEK